MQVVLEFMDKGMKGLLTGDLSVYIIQQIQTSIDKFQAEFETTSRQIEELLEKQSSLDSFYNEHFAVGGVAQQSGNLPSYEYYQNFESYLSIIEKTDWKKHVQLKDKNDYSVQVNLAKFVNPELISSA